VYQISGFSGGVVEAFALVGCDAALVGKFYLTFVDPQKWDRASVYEVLLYQFKIIRNKEVSTTKLQMPYRSYSVHIGDRLRGLIQNWQLYYCPERILFVALDSTSDW
jgi:hypothetical protein